MKPAPEVLQLLAQKFDHLVYEASVAANDLQLDQRAPRAAVAAVFAVGNMASGIAAVLRATAAGVHGPELSPHIVSAGKAVVGAPRPSAPAAKTSAELVEAAHRAIANVGRKGGDR